MSADSIDHPLLEQESSGKEEPAEDGTASSERPPSSSDSRENGPSKTPNTFKPDGRAVDESQQVKDDQDQVQHGGQGKTRTSLEDKTRGQNGGKLEAQPVNSDHSKKRSEENLAAENRVRKGSGSEIQQEKRSQKTSQGKDNAPEDKTPGQTGGKLEARPVNSDHSKKRSEENLAAENRVRKSSGSEIQQEKRSQKTSQGKDNAPEDKTPGQTGGKLETPAVVGDHGKKQSEENRAAENRVRKGSGSEIQPEKRSKKTSLGKDNAPEDKTPGQTGGKLETPPIISDHGKKQSGENLAAENRVRKGSGSEIQEETRSKKTLLGKDNAPEDKTPGQTGGKLETPPIISDHGKKQSEDNHAAENRVRKGSGSEIQLEIRNQKTFQGKDNVQREQVQRSNADPRQEASRPRSSSSVTAERYNQSSPYNLRSTSNATPTTFVDFYLYVHGDEPVDEVSLVFGGEKPISLHRVGSEIKLWHYELPLSCDFQNQHIEYRYRVFVKGHDSNFPVFGRFFRKDASVMDEVGKRIIKSNKQYDVFHFPDDIRYFSESIPRSVMFYISWLLQAVNTSNISQILEEVEEMRFTYFSAKHVRELIAWVVEQVVEKSTTDAEALYLCIVLGHLSQKHSKHFRFPNDNTKKAFDRLLDSFRSSVLAPFCSASSLGILDNFASVLVQCSNSPCWLNLVATFYPYLGVHYLLKKKHDTDFKEARYDMKEYRKLMDMLLKNVDITKEEEHEHQCLLQAVLERAPNNDAVVELFDKADTDKFFEDEGKKEDFFVKFYQDNHYNATRRGTGEKLVELLKIPRTLRGKLYRLVNSCLLDFVRSGEKMEEEQIKAFIDLIISDQCLQEPQVNDLLIEISRSKSVDRHKLLLKILETSQFRDNWHLTSMTQKIRICSSWVTNKVTNEMSIRNGIDKTTAVYHGLELLMCCPLNKSYNQLAEEVSRTVNENLLRNEESLSVLRAFGNISKYSTVVQDCYKAHVKEILCRDRRVIKRSVNVLDEYSNSSLGNVLLSYVLDILDVPSVRKDSVDEAMFKSVLDWCDVWTILLKTGGYLERYKKFKDGKLICEHLKACIEDANVSINFLEEIKDKIEQVAMLCGGVMRSTSTISPYRLKKDITDRVSDMTHVVQDCSKKLELVGSVLDYGRKMSDDIHSIEGFQMLVKELNERKSNWRTKRVKELQDDKFWLPLIPLIQAAKTLQPLMSSLSFMTVAKKGLEESSSDKTESGNARDFYSLVQFLTNNAIEELQTQWNPVLNDPGSLSVKTMKTLLGTLKNQNRLDEELELLEKYFAKPFSPYVKIYIEDYVKYPYILKTVKHVIGILEIFKLLDLSNETVSVLYEFEKMFDTVNELTLEALHQAMTDVDGIVSVFSEENMDGVIEQLSRSSALLGFVKEIVDEDIRFLIDAVEEHSDQFVSESSVSDLIDVHGFLTPLIKEKNQKQCNALYFLGMLKKSCRGHKDIASKIQQCSTNVNSLRGLYTSIANRGEITKEIISSCLSKGVYHVSLKEDGTCEANMSYHLKGKSEKPRNYSLSDLHDMRSRAHLIINSHKNTFKDSSSHLEKNSEDIDFDDFIIQINLLTEICTLLSKLRFSGFVKYRKFWKRMSDTADLQDTWVCLQHELETWESILSKAREECYFLNYYRSDQLCVLYDFLINKSNVDCEMEVLSLIHFVDKTITKQQLLQHQEERKKLTNSHSDDNPSLFLSTIGQVLGNIFNNPQRVVRWTPDDGQNLSYVKLEATVSPGEIFVASLEPDSSLTANVMLSLYENTSNAYPEAYQIVLCSSETTWEEIYLLLQRCFNESKYRDYNSLFCIANVELLPNELQFKLVDTIKNKQKCHQSSVDAKECAGYQLALICRGGEHHHIVEEFAQYSHHIAGMADHVLTHRLQSGWPDVKMITSTLPGLGKTEYIKREAQEKDMNIVTFSISGPFEPNKLIQRLKKLRLKKYHCLHLDIGDVSDPLLLDTFLFQLVVTGMVSAGMQFYHLPTTHVYIEIANTLDDALRESLVVSKYFNRVHLVWQNYKNLLVSPEITSNVQVVCQYLDVFHSGCIESKEVHFSGPKKSKPLSAGRCQELLERYFLSDADITFTVLNTFLGVLADQFLKFSKSAFFKIASLKSMLGEDAKMVRTYLFSALLEVSKEFASRSITTGRSTDVQRLSQEESVKALDKALASTVTRAENMVKRVEGMIQWEDSNHLLVVFHGFNSQAITAVYRSKALVPQSVEKLLKSQGVKGNRELEDFKTLTQEQLQEKLEKIACTKLMNQTNLFSTYALTPDNILKMILIILRVRANAPVIIMGETGCGKTSLVRYLANTCGIRFQTFNFHAGISEDEIIKFIEDMEMEANDKSDQMWIFLDEINTCDHLGLISDIMCHHSLLGRPLSNNLVFLAACNPYKLRPVEHVKTAGLEGKNITDEYSGLVYRVHPLPEAMIDYVWDYGSLAPKDERDYIQRMVSVLPKQYEGMLVGVLAASQQFIREAERNHFCVSLRDVHRCILLVHSFQEMDKKRKELKNNERSTSKHLREYYQMSERYNDKPMIKSVVLALAHCYLSRLPTAKLRQNYREHMMKVITSNGIAMNKRGNVDSFSAIIRVEEEDYLDRMELPPGTARNAALRENVFVMLVSILNHIPVFVVGKPGCSKSLSIQLIRSNLRGRDSRDSLFRKLPQLYVVSYQGSESSTSEGIIKVFEKARKYKSHNNDGNVLPVVLLDEVGLAENSKYNPLKVLHSLLEPGEGKLPDVAVVGISNWSLDAAKMNRAIHLSRPEPTKEDLYETGHSLHYADGEENNQYLGRRELQYLAESYFEYQAEQSHAHFHGLRDYYSLIKSLNGCNNFEQVNISLQRNFGGLPGEVAKIQKIFLDKLKTLMTSSGEDIIPVTRLIQENLTDPYARHLMLLTSGDSASGILKQSLAQLKKEIITIYGSYFEEDLSEEYNYRILSRIILCMERDCILILRDLDRIYGSLYDMLNQNYAVVGNRKNCRVALGAYSNPMCQVSDGFRCIVLIDQHKVDFSDPPFLNRFEKQLLRFSDVVNEDQQHVIDELRRWVEGISTVEGLEAHFNETDMFIGFHGDTLPSLVLSHGSDTDVLKKCKDDLMWIASPDGVLRAQKCNLLRYDSHEVKELSDEYFNKPLHQGFAAFMKHVLSNHQRTSFFGSDEIGSKTIVMTFSNIHTDIRQCLDDSFRCQVERLSAYKSEKQLAERIDEFWNAPKKELLILQCKPELDGTHLLLARSIIEEKRNSYKNTQECKHVCIVLHVQRGEVLDDVQWQFSFLCGWRQVFLDVLETPLVPLNEILGESIQKLLTSSIWPIRAIAQNDLLWCFTCIKYMRVQRSLDTVAHIAKNLFNSEEVSRVFEKIILRSIDLNAIEEHAHDFKESWQVRVACDRQSLINSSTLYCAMEQFVSRLVRIPLAKIVFFLEKENSWPPHLLNCSTDESLKFESIWCSFFVNETIFKISEIPEPRGAESYALESTSLDLSLPFSQVVIRKVDIVKQLFLEEYATLVECEDDLDKNGQFKENIQKEQLRRFSKMISNLVPELGCFTFICYDSYMKDLFDITTADFSSLSRQERISIAQAVFVSEVKQNLPAEDTLEFFALLHIFVWVYREQILAVLRMVDCCNSFIPSETISSVTDAISLEDIVFVNSREDVYDTVESGELGSEDESEDSNSQDETADQLTTNVEEYLLEWEMDTATGGSKYTETAPTEIERELQGPLQIVQEDKNDVNDNEIEIEGFGDILVTAYAEKMFPSQEVVLETNGGLETWIRNAKLLISLAFKISEHSPAFHYLRLCVDFAQIILTSSTSHLSSLYTLSEIADHLTPEYLDHNESFQTITHQVITPLEDATKNHKKKRKALQRFLALFYGRCIDTNVDTSCALPIVENVLSLERPELTMMMSPVVLRLLMVEEMQSPGIFVHLISNPSAIEKCPCLQNINDVFKDRFSNGLIHHDSYSAVMICDLIQSLLNFEKNFSFDDMDSSNCEVLVLAKTSTILLSQSDEVSCGLTVLSAVAFLRGFFKMLAQFIAGNPGALTEDGEFVYIMTEVNSLLKESIPSLKLFFLKQLSECANLFDAQKWCQESKVLPTIKELWHNEKSPADKVVFTSVFKYPEYKEAKAAFWKLCSNEESSMNDFLTKCNSSPNHAYALLGILVNMVFLKRSVQRLTDRDEHVVNWFNGKIASLPPFYQELFFRVLGRRNFHCPQLQLSPESSVEDVEMALLILHIACVVATSALKEHLPVYRYFTNPLTSQHPCTLAHCEGELHSVFEFLPSIKRPSPVTCTCGLRLAFKDVDHDQVCPHCHQDFSKETLKSTPIKVISKMQRPSSGDTTVNWHASVKHMSPAVYRALRVIVYSSYYGGIALGTSSDDKLSAVLKMLCGSGTDCSNPAELCFESVKTDLSHLSDILCCKKNVAIKVMHLVVEKSSDLMKSAYQLPGNDPERLRMRQEWETVFSKLTEPIFLKTRESSKDLKNMARLQQAEIQSNDTSIEGCILEIDAYPSESQEQNEQLKRLYRHTKCPSFEDFRSAFLYSPKGVQEKHSFLTLFFVAFDHLPIIGELHHLLKWSRLVSSALTHRISRKDAHSKSINDFISGHLLEIHRNPQEIDSLKKMFINFKSAWKKMRQLVNQELTDEKVEEMPRLREIDYIAYCLIESDYGIYLRTAIGLLVSSQNSILDKIISLSSLQRYPALSFLEKENSSGVMSVSIQQVKEKEIISFQWSDDLFKYYAQNNLEYGKGKEIQYDFERIEIVLASKVAFGKCYLTGTLNKFIFAKELFHSCGPLLTEIRSLVTQSASLPEEVRKGLSTLKERRIKEAQDLLQHIEVLIFLIKPKLKNFDVNMTLEELVEKWLSILPSPFPVALLPQPRSSIKIKHIAALYEALEDVLADGAIEGLADRFSRKLPMDMTEKLDALVEKGIEQFKPQNLLIALRRFVFRYLSSETERYWPEESTALQSCLKEPSLWSPLQPPNLHEIPEEISLENIHSVVNYLKELDKERKVNVRKSGVRNLPRTTQTSKQPSRRRIKNFSYA